MNEMLLLEKHDREFDEARLETMECKMAESKARLATARAELAAREEMGLLSLIALVIRELFFAAISRIKRLFVRSSQSQE